MSKKIAWLHGEIESWVTGSIIDRQQADAIRAIYRRQADASWGAGLFLGLGAVIFGLGVILLFAYNWEALPKAVKLAAVFAAVIATHGAGAWMYLKRPGRRAIAESLLVAGTMFFGAGIWLVAQIYHIDEHFPNGLLIWAIGALALACALPSVAEGLLAAVLFTTWCAFEATEFRHAIHWAPLLPGALIGLAWMMRSRVLLGAAVPAVIISFLFNASALHWDLVLPIFFSLGALLIAAGHLVRRFGGFPHAHGVLAFYGWALYLSMLFLLTFRHPELIRDLDRWSSRMVEEGLWYRLPPLILAAAAWLWLALARRKRQLLPVPADQWLAPCMLLIFEGCLIAPEGSGWMIMGLFNMAFLGHAAAWMMTGVRTGSFPPAILGTMLLAALTLARYFDLFTSLAARGAAFLLIGGALIAEGILVARTRKARSKQEAQA